MAWATSLLGTGGTTAATTAGTTAATTAGAAASAAPAVSGSTGLMGSLKSALGSDGTSSTGQLIQKLTGPGQQASAQAAAGQAESQKGMQFANAGSGQPQLQHFATQTTPISSGTYDPISQLERFRMYQGR